MRCCVKNHCYESSYVTSPLNSTLHVINDFVHEMRPLQNQLLYLLDIWLCPCSKQPDMKGTILSSSHYGPWSTDRTFVLVRAWLNPWLSHGFCSIKLPRVFVVPHAKIPVQQRIAQQYFTWENDSYKAQNNFWMVARHNDQPKKFFSESSLVSDRSKYRKELLMTLPPCKLWTIICLSCTSHC